MILCQPNLFINVPSCNSSCGVTGISGTFDLLLFNVSLGILGALVLKWHVTQKHLAVQQNGVKFGNQGQFYVYLGYLYPISVQGHFGSFRALVSKWPVSRKWLVVERSEVKFRRQGLCLYAYGVHLTC